MILLVYVPSPSFTALEAPPPINLTYEMSVQRDLTLWFIALDPTLISLIPVTHQKTPTGATKRVDLPPKPPQNFKLIAQSDTQPPLRTSAGTAGSSQDQGRQRKYDYVLLGAWDSDIREGDWWEDEGGQRWVVDSLSYYNGYERKGLVLSYGGSPT